LFIVRQFGLKAGSLGEVDEAVFEEADGDGEAEGEVCGFGHKFVKIVKYGEGIGL